MSANNNFAKLYALGFTLLALAAWSPAPLKGHTKYNFVPEASQAVREQQQGSQVTQGIVGDQEQVVPEVRGPQHNSGDAASAIVSTTSASEAKGETAIKAAGEDVERPARKWINSFFLLLLSIGVPLAAISGVRKLLDARIPGPKQGAKTGW